MLMGFYQHGSAVTLPGLSLSGPFINPPRTRAPLPSSSICALPNHIYHRSITGEASRPKPPACGKRLGGGSFDRIWRTLRSSCDNGGGGRNLGPLPPNRTTAARRRSCCTITRWSCPSHPVAWCASPPAGWPLVLESGNHSRKHRPFKKKGWRGGRGRCGLGIK